MAKVKFIQDTIDAVSRERYSAGSDFVEVSDAFAERLKDSALLGSAFVFEEAKQAPVEKPKKK